MILGGLSLLTGYRPKLGAALIGTFLAGVTPTMHAFWKDENPQERQMNVINFLKNVALAGAAMLAAGKRFVPRSSFVVDRTARQLPPPRRFP